MSATTHPEWFEVAKAHMSRRGDEGILRAAIGHGAFTVAMAGSDRMLSADAVATIEAAQIGAHAAILTVLEHLTLIREDLTGDEFDRELSKLLQAARAGDLP
jgi:hypothetical protein